MHTPSDPDPMPPPPPIFELRVGPGFHMSVQLVLPPVSLGILTSIVNALLWLRWTGWLKHF